MFKPKPIDHVRIFLLRKDLDKTISLLYRLKIAQFHEEEMSEELEKIESESLNDLNKDLLRHRSALEILKEFYPESQGKTVKHKKPVDKILELKERYDKTYETLETLQDEYKRQRILKQLHVKKNELTDSNTVIGFIPKDNKKYLQKLTGKKGFRKYQLKDRIYFKAPKKIVDFGYKEFYLPENKDEELDEKIKNNKDVLENVTSRLKNLSFSYYKKLQKEEKDLEKKVRSEEIKDKFAGTKNVVMLNAYVPQNKVKTLKKYLNKELGDEFEIEVQKASNPPTLLSNSGSISKFEELLKLYSFPTYKEIDPTMLNALIFPLFFGFILGDVVYGILSLIFFSLMKRKFSQFSGFISILQASAVSSMIFGLIYGEFLGFEPYHPLIARAHSPEFMLMIVVIFGLIHINLGLILGFLNKKEHMREAVFEKLSWIVMELGVAGLATGIYYSITSLITVGAIVLLASFYMIYKGEGFIGLIEVPSFFTNILSYARLMAVGLSSVAIAMLINEYSQILFSKGILFAVLGVLLFFIGHIFNIILGNFESFLHTLRLHYVEFFTKFYQGGGEEFKPFGSESSSE